MHEVRICWLDYIKVNASIIAPIIKNVKNIRFSLKKKLINLKISRESFFDNGLKIKLKINLAKLNVFLNKDLIKLRINLKNNLRNGGRTYFITTEVIQYKIKNSSTSIVMHHPSHQNEN